MDSEKSSFFNVRSFYLGLFGTFVILLLIHYQYDRRQIELNQTIMCQTNLHKIGVGLSAYVADYNETLPPTIDGQFVNGSNHNRSTWIALLSPYMKGTIGPCPSRQLPGRFAENSSEPNIRGYAYNAWLGPSETQLHQTKRKIVAISDIDFPGNTTSVYDARAGIIAGEHPDVGTSRDKLTGVYTAQFIEEVLAQDEGARRHCGAAEYLFIDGQVRHLKLTDFGKKYVVEPNSPGFRFY